MADDAGKLWIEARPLPAELPAGRGDAVFIFGACFHPHREILNLEILVDGEPHAPTDFGLPRLDVFRRLHPNLGGGEDPIPSVDRDSLEDPEVRCYRSGFWGTVPIPARELGAETVVAVRAALAGGRVETEEIGRIVAADPRLGALDADAASDPSDGRIAIALATYNPDMDLFRAQIESLREQTDDDWVCVVSDDRSRPDRFRQIADELAGDDRFLLSRNERRLGVYRNFERALELVPEDAAFVALCDQDDRWYPEKLESLRRAIGDSQLVYSDQRIISREGNVLADTYWTDRPNNHTNLLSLLIANTITGAASLMRREVVQLALPFPDVPSEQYHDHWLGLVAMTSGEVAYVDRPLYDYVQHAGAALGHAQANTRADRPGRARKLIGITYWRARFAHAHDAYFRSYIRLRLLAAALLERVPAMTRSKRSALKRFASADESPFGIGWLRVRALRALGGHGETLGAEAMLAESLVWRHAMRYHSREWQRPIGSPFDASLPGPEAGHATEALPDPETAHIERLIAPLEFSVSSSEPERVNLLLPTIDLQHLFGGYIAKFNLARKLAERGHRVRIVTVDPTPPLPEDWRERVEGYSGLSGAMSRIEVAFAREQGRVAISPSDRFVATTWWTAYHARDAVAMTGRDRFLYLIQEYEPFTFVMGSWAAVARETYAFPHTALFSTEFLRRYFAANRIGVYTGDGDRDSVSFQNAITSVRPPPASEMADRDGRRMLFYARSEPHAKRNMFELGMIALSRTIESGAFGDEWEFFGIGSVSGRSRVALPHGNELDVLPRLNQSDYGEILGRHDVGLSLMLTPHPSLVPIEMASAGLVTVTNTFETKTADSLSAISGNLIAAEPSIEGIAAGLSAAVARSGDHDARIRNSAVDWSDDWERSLGEEVMGTVDRLLGFG